MINNHKPERGDVPLFGKPPGYRSYLLRFWQERSEESSLTVWRYSLEDPLTNRRLGFSSLDALVAWLQSEMAQVEGSAEK